MSKTQYIVNNLLDSTINYKVSTQKLIYKNSYIVWMKTSVPFRHYCNFEMKKRWFCLRHFSKTFKERDITFSMCIYIYLSFGLKIRFVTFARHRKWFQVFESFIFLTNVKFICIMLSFKNWIRNWNYFWNRKMQRRDIQV